MADAGFPRQAAPTPPAPRAPTIVIPMPAPTTTEPSDIRIRFDPEYFKTVPGIVKIVQISFGILAFICIQASVDHASPSGIYFSSISMIAVLCSGTLLGLYVYHVVEKTQHRVPWVKIELVYCGLWTLLYLLAASVTIGQWGNNPFIAAGSIGFRATAAYGVDFYLKWGAYSRGNQAQEPRIEFQLPPATNIPVIAIVGSSTA